MTDNQGSEIHVAEACAIFSPNKTRQTRGMGRISRWKYSQKWFENLEEKTYREHLELEPNDFVVWMEEKEWSIGKEVQCIELKDTQCERVDSISSLSCEAFGLVQNTSCTSKNIYLLQQKFLLKAFEQAIEIVGHDKESLAITKSMKSNIDRKSYRKDLPLLSLTKARE